MIFIQLTNNWMFPQTDKSLRDYRVLNQNWSYQPTLEGCAITKHYPLAFSPVWEIAVHLAIAGGVYDGVFFPRAVLDEVGF